MAFKFDTIKPNSAYINEYRTESSHTDMLVFRVKKIILT